MWLSLLSSREVREVRNDRIFDEALLAVPTGPHVLMWGRSLTLTDILPVIVFTYLSLKMAG
jgi:hypothetical protein